MTNKSSWIADISHDDTDNSLLVETTTGELYKHSDVPQTVATEFENAPSKGAYYNTKIRKQYACDIV